MDGKLRNMTSIYLLDDEENILMLYRIGSKALSMDCYIGTAGGHFEKDELNDARACVLRELREETGIEEKDIKDIKLRYVTLRCKKDELRNNYYFYAKLVNKEKNIKSNEGNLKWFKLNEVPIEQMPHTAKYAMKHYLDIGRYDNKLYGGIATENGVEFTELKSFE